MKLNDPEIRFALLNYLGNLRFKPSKILEELHIHRGNAIADVVALHQEPHCYEIKGDNDNILRLKKQGYFYDQAFRKITLVTTKKQLKRALVITPQYWGIVIADLNQNRVKLKPYRRAKISPYFNKEIAIQTLWRDEMLRMIINSNLNVDMKLNKAILAKDIALKSTIKNVQETISKSLSQRNSIN